MAKNKPLLRIKELEEVTGLNRRTIHYYMKEGLLSPPLRTGKTMAYYSMNHIDEISHIQKLRDEGYPVSLIKQGLSKKNERETDTAVRGKRNAQKKRNLIIEKAVEIFASVGYHQANISSIAKEAEIVPGTIYLYFPSKKALFMACLNRVYYAMFKDANEELWSEKQPIKRLLKRAEMVLRSHTQFIDILQVLSNAFVDDPDMKVKCKDTYDLILYPIEKDLNKAIKEGIFPPLNVEAVGYVLLGLMASAQTYFSMVKDSSIEEFMGVIDELIFHRRPPLKSSRS